MTKNNKDPWGLLRDENDEVVGPKELSDPSPQDGIKRVLPPGTAGFEDQSKFQIMCENVRRAFHTEQDYEILLKQAENDATISFDAVHHVYDEKFGPRI